MVEIPRRPASSALRQRTPQTQIAGTESLCGPTVAVDRAGGSRQPADETGELRDLGGVRALRRPRPAVEEGLADRTARKGAGDPPRSTRCVAHEVEWLEGANHVYHRRTMVERNPQPLIHEDDIARRVSELATEISRDYADADELLMIGVLRGCFIFLADLSRRITIPHRIDFISVQSYQGAESGAVRMLMDVRSDIRGKHVLIVEDIIDSGETVKYLRETLQARRPASLKTCAFVRKEGRRGLDVQADYLGLEIPDVWVVGYGLDYNDQYRSLPYIGALEPETVVAVERDQQHP